MFQHGRTFVLHKAEEAPPCQQDIFYRNEGHRVLMWGNPGDRSEDPARSLRLDEVTDVFLGKQTSGFSSAAGRVVPEDRCFSIISPEVKLDIEASSVKQCVAWAFGVMSLLRSSGMSILHPSVAAGANADEIIPFTPSDQTDTVLTRKIEEEMAAGGEFVLHSSSGTTKDCSVYLQSGGEEGSSLRVTCKSKGFLFGSKSPTEEARIPMSSITDLFLGKHDGTPFADERNKDLHQSLCFAISYNSQNGGHSQMFLAAFSAEQRDAWAHGLHKVLNYHNIPNTLYPPPNLINLFINFCELNAEEYKYTACISTKTLNGSWSDPKECLDIGNRKFKCDLFVGEETPAQQIKFSMYLVDKANMQKSLLGYTVLATETVLSYAGQDLVYTLLNNEDKNLAGRLRSHNSSLVVHTPVTAVVTKYLNSQKEMSRVSNLHVSTAASRASSMFSRDGDTSSMLSVQSEGKWNTMEVVDTPSGSAPKAIVENLQTILKVSRELQQGMILTRHFGDLPAQRTRFYVRNVGTALPAKKTQKFGSLYWCLEGEEPTADPKRCLALADVTDIYVGKRTSALQKGSCAPIPDEHCFSVISSRAHVTLDIEAPDAQTRGVFLSSLGELFKCIMTRSQTMEQESGKKTVTESKPKQSWEKAAEIANSVEGEIKGFDFEGSVLSGDSSMLDTPYLSEFSAFASDYDSDVASVTFSQGSWGGFSKRKEVVTLFPRSFYMYSYINPTKNFMKTNCIFRRRSNASWNLPTYFLTSNA